MFMVGFDLDTRSYSTFPTPAIGLIKIPAAGLFIFLF